MLLIWLLVRGGSISRLLMRRRHVSVLPVNHRSLQLAARLRAGVDYSQSLAAMAVVSQEALTLFKCRIALEAEALHDHMMQG
jgi:hypothetical protein